MWEELRQNEENVFLLQKPESMLTDLKHRKLFGACLITISLSLDCISNKRIKTTRSLIGSCASSDNQPLK